jgi:hypothetical protein
MVKNYFKIDKIPRGYRKKQESFKTCEPYSVTELQQHPTNKKAMF